MGLFDRLSTLLRSNINDLISRAEDPEKMLSQILVDMRSQLAKAKQQVATAIADEKRLRDQADGEYRQAQDWEKRAMLALQENREDLAKQALVRQSEHMTHAQQLEHVRGIIGLAGVGAERQVRGRRAGGIVGRVRGLGSGVERLFLRPVRHHRRLPGQRRRPLRGERTREAGRARDPRRGRIFGPEVDRNVVHDLVRPGTARRVQTGRRRHAGRCQRAR